MIAILGRGAWGQALGATLSQAGREVRFWTRGDDPSWLAGARTVIAAVPAQATREVLAHLHDHLDPSAWLVLTAKGLEKRTMALQTGIAQAAAPRLKPAVLTGPSFAADLSRGLPTAVTLATREPGAEALQETLATPSLRPYLSHDPVGAQLGGALKNVVAIACGAAIGAGYGESARAALMTRGFAEMTRLGTALGAEPETLAGLSGLGDLALTCASSQSRNYALGLAIGAGRTPGEASGDGRTYEGLATASEAVSLARAKGVEAPVAEVTAALVAGNLTPAAAFGALFNRPLRRET